MRLILTSNLQNPHESIIQAQAGRGRALILDRLCYYLTNNPRRLLASCYQNVSVCPGLLATKRTAESTRSSKKQPHEREHEQSVVLSSRVTKLKIIRRRRRRLLLHSRIDSIRFMRCTPVTYWRSGDGHSVLLPIKRERALQWMAITTSSHFTAS
jgi:hypothetical protein